MNTLRWLGVVAVLAAVLALIRAAFGESLVGMAIFFVVVLATVQCLLGASDWTRAVLAGLMAAVMVWGWLRLFEPADTVAKQVGMALYMLVPLAVLVFAFLKDRRRSLSHS